jgi:hypothetical protein
MANKEIVQAIRDFLNNASFEGMKSCSKCGLLMEHATATVVFDGSPWEVRLPFCPKCTAGASRFKPNVRHVA